MKRIVFHFLAVFLIASSVSAQSDQPNVDDYLRQMQLEASESDECDWGRWGDRASKYSSWTYHSNRLVPIYTFGLTLDKFTGDNSSYRSEEILTDIYGELPEGTLDPKATYMDQTEVYYLQKAAIKAGKRNIILIVLDGMDWQTSQAAAIYRNKSVVFEEGYGSGLAFLDYDKCEKDQGDFVCSPHNSGTKFDIDSQTVSNIGGDKRGGYSADFGGYHSWSKPTSESYLLGKLLSLNHVVTDSESAATAMCSGVKTYNSAINVDHEGKSLTPIARELQQDGFSVGVVTSVPISHATPASAYANNVNRNDYQDLTRDLVGLPSISNRDALPGMDVVLGCGWDETNDDDRKKQGRNYVPGNKYISAQDLENINEANGGKYVVSQRTAGLKGSVALFRATKRAVQRNQRLFGLFGHDGGHLPYQTADGNYDPTRGQKKADRYTEDELKENPTLAEMTTAALEVLGENKRGFWLMIESGDVDWANHNNNIDDSIGSVYSGEAAFEAVTQWIEKNSSWDKSAVIVTADHGHFFVLTDPTALTGHSRETLEAENANDNRCP